MLCSRYVTITQRLISSNLNCQELIELNAAPHSDWYHTVCMKCLRALCKARNAVPSSLFLRDVTKEGGNPVGGGGFAVRVHSTLG